MSRRLLPLGLMSALVVGGCAGSILPSHIHDRERAARTSKLVSIIDAYGQNAPSIYETMLKSSRAIAVEQDKVLAELANSRAAAFGEQLPFMTLTNLNLEKGTVQGRVNRVQELLTTNANKFLQEQKFAATEAQNAAEAISEAKQAADAAKRDVTSWNASIALLQAGVAELPNVARQSGSDGKASGVQELTKRLRDVGAKEVEFIDGGGVKRKRQIKDILSEHVNAAVKEGDDNVRIPDAPGATLTILTLGLDLARIQKQRAEVRLVQISRRLALYERVSAESAMAAELLKQVTFTGSEQELPFEQNAVRLIYEVRVAHREVAGAVEAGLEGKEKEFIGALRTADRKMLSLANHLLMLRKLTVADAVSLRAELGLERSSRRLDHEESIQASQINDLAWRGVLRTGVAVLDQYEQGGLKAEDIANIIRVAQTLALGVIAGGLY